MKSIILLLVMASASALAQTVADDGAYSVPARMPGEVLAGTVWPGVVDVWCLKRRAEWNCEGYHIEGTLKPAQQVHFRPSNE
jgi:hypothetical protein